jgi:hypothetical protein
MAGQSKRLCIMKLSPKQKTGTSAAPFCIASRMKPFFLAHRTNLRR